MKCYSSSIHTKEGHLTSHFLLSVYIDNTPSYTHTHTHTHTHIAEKGSRHNPLVCLTTQSYGIRGKHPRESGWVRSRLNLGYQNGKHIWEDTRGEIMTPCQS